MRVLLLLPVTPLERRLGIDASMACSTILYFGSGKDSHIRHVATTLRRTGKRDLSTWTVLPGNVIRYRRPECGKVTDP